MAWIVPLPTLTRLPPPLWKLTVSGTEIALTLTMSVPPVSSVTLAEAGVPPTV